MSAPAANLQRNPPPPSPPPAPPPRSRPPTRRRRRPPLGRPPPGPGPRPLPDQLPPAPPLPHTPLFPHARAGDAPLPSPGAHFQTPAPGLRAASAFPPRGPPTPAPEGGCPGASPAQEEPQLFAPRPGQAPGPPAAPGAEGSAPDDVEETDGDWVAADRSAMAAQGRERGEERRGAGEREGRESHRTGGALRSPLAAPAPRTGSDRLTDRLSPARPEGGSASAQAHKGPAGGRRPRRGAQRRRTQAQELSLGVLHATPLGGRGREKQPQRGVARRQAPPATETEVGGGLRIRVPPELCGWVRVGGLRVLPIEVSFCFHQVGSPPQRFQGPRLLSDAFPPVTPVEPANHSAE